MWFLLSRRSKDEWTSDPQTPQIITWLRATVQWGPIQILLFTPSASTAPPNKIDMCQHICMSEIFLEQGLCPSAGLLTHTAQAFYQQSLLKISLSFSQCTQFANILPQVSFAPWPLEKVLSLIHQDKIKLWILYLLYSLETWSQYLHSRVNANVNVLRITLQGLCLNYIISVRKSFTGRLSLP